MVAITAPPNSVSKRHLRPFDPRRDANAVADLIETSFADTLDPDGQRYLRQMRSTAQRRGLDRWIMLAPPPTSPGLAGFVWEEGGKIVGNVSMIPFFSQGRRLNLIANVAVLPEYRRRGIAEAMTTAVLDRSRKQRIASVWLHVRDNNPAALALYKKLGFDHRDHRTTWSVEPGNLRGEVPPGIEVTSRKSGHWVLQRSWLDENYPPALRWHYPLQILAFQAGLLGFLYRVSNEIEVRHWAVQRGSELLGVLTWQGTYGYTDRLWLAAPPAYEEIVLQAVLPCIRRGRELRRPFTLDYPAGRCQEVLASAGFELRQTLIWMEMKL